MYASLSARCHASSPSDRPPGSGRKSYCVGGNACRSFTVLAASRSHEARNVSSSFTDIEPPSGTIDILPPGKDKPVTDRERRRESAPRRTAGWRLTRCATARRLSRSLSSQVESGSAPGELEVHDVWRGNRSDELEPLEIVADAVKQPLAAGEERRHQADLHFVHEPGREILPRRVRSTGERYILASGGPPRLLERGGGAAGDERERRAAFELERLASMMGEHEYRVME